MDRNSSRACRAALFVSSVTHARHEHAPDEAETLVDHSSGPYPCPHPHLALTLASPPPAPVIGNVCKILTVLINVCIWEHHASEVAMEPNFTVTHHHHPSPSPSPSPITITIIITHHHHHHHHHRHHHRHRHRHRHRHPHRHDSSRYPPPSFALVDGHRRPTHLFACCCRLPAGAPAEGCPRGARQRHLEERTSAPLPPSPSLSHPHSSPSFHAPQPITLIPSSPPSSSPGAQPRGDRTHHPDTAARGDRGGLGGPHVSEVGRACEHSSKPREGFLDQSQGSIVESALGFLEPTGNRAFAAARVTAALCQRAGVGRVLMRD